MSAAVVASSEIGAQAMCEAIGLARATYYRHLISESSQPGTQTLERQPPARALSDDERKMVLGQLTSDRFEIGRAHV